MTVDLSAIAKWPNVPDCYDWLSLDRRGNWRLQGERVTHRGLIDFMNRQYGSDASGRWFVQNGPQRVYVDLAYTPLIYRRNDLEFISHNGLQTGEIMHFFLDAEGNLLIEATPGIGLLDDRDLSSLFGECTDSRGKPVEESSLLALMAGAPTDILWQGTPLKALPAVDIETQFKFIAKPSCGINGQDS